MDDKRKQEIWDTYHMALSAMSEYRDTAANEPDQVAVKWGGIGFRYYLRLFSTAIDTILKHEQDLSPFLKSYGLWVWESIEYMLSPNEQPPVLAGGDDKGAFDKYQQDWAYCSWEFYDTYEEYMYGRGEYELNAPDA